MKITKRQLRRIIREMHPRAAADDAYVADLEKKEDELATQIRHASKDIHGYKDHYDLHGKSVEELEDILYDLANSQEQRAMDLSDRDEIEDQMGRDQELSRAEMAPRRQGMSRRPGGSKSQRRMESKMKITKNQLRRIIKEEKARLLKEGPGGTMQGAEEKLFNALEEYVGVLITSFGGDAGVRELKAEVLTFVDGYFEHAEDYEDGAGERGSSDW